MGWNDHIDDSELGNLPLEAFDNVFDVEGPFEPNNFWLERATKDDQLTAMREWFLARFCDPANDTPYNGREGGYLFLHGSHDPDDELHSRFGGHVDEEIINNLVNDLHTEVGDEWAPIIREIPDDYDLSFALEIDSPGAPLDKLRERIRQSRLILTLEGSHEAKALAQKLVFSSIIGALEAFLWETVDYWINADDAVLQNIVAKSSIFKDRKLILGEIFKRIDGLKSEVRGHLQRMVWHRLDDVATLFLDGFSVRLPNTEKFREHIIKRHDIVHRSGHTVDGDSISVTTAEINEISESVERFAVAVVESLGARPWDDHGTQTNIFD